MTLCNKKQERTINCTCNLISARKMEIMKNMLCFLLMFCVLIKDVESIIADTEIYIEQGLALPNSS